MPFKVKIFVACLAYDLEKSINDWISNNPNIVFVDIKHYFGGMHYVLLTYSE